jgi:hypothetical protein
MEMVGEKMAIMEINKTEVVGLIGIVLFDSTSKKLQPETRTLLSSLRNQLFNDLLDYYKGEEIYEPEVRLGNLIMLLQGVKIHALRSQENMQLLRTFNVVNMGDLFEEVVTD